ncbi:hypothetical protein [Geothrix edaphica]|uniref:Uncharacterized protein n=1 Tax=Geothrix edaphica TaxID=2927976 RepID=A0ABQ5PUY3_9BACT|nr:hypothetical protein [Geothrix edaphica]GLH65974.1 hypothetical protein GETHED_03380 [Geothrix edaphica]
MSIQVSLVYENEHGIRGSLSYGFPRKAPGEYALQVGYTGFSERQPPQTMSEAKELAHAGHSYSRRLNDAELLALKGALVGEKCPYARVGGSSFARGCVLTEDMVAEIGEHLFALKEVGWDWTQRIDPIRWMVLNRLQMEYQGRLREPFYIGQSILIRILPTHDKVEECAIEVSPEIALDLAHQLTLAAHKALPAHIVEIASVHEVEEELS